MILLWATLIGFASARCEPIPPNGRRTPFAARAHARGKVILELPLFGVAKPPTEILMALHAHDLRATLLVTRTWAIEHPDFIKQAAAQGHEVGVLGGISGIAWSPYNRQIEDYLYDRHHRTNKQEEYRKLDFKKIFNKMEKPAFIFDGRNHLNHKELYDIGFNVYSVGKTALTHF